MAKKEGGIDKATLAAAVAMLAPFAPHMAEEMWEVCGFGKMMAADGQWPTYDEAKCIDETIEIVVQINGKIRAKLNVAADIEQADAIAAAKADEKVAAELDGKNIIKEIYVKGKLVNIVAK